MQYTLEYLSFRLGSHVDHKLLFSLVDCILLFKFDACYMPVFQHSFVLVSDSSSM